MNKKMKKNKKGFTLIELIVVIVIIGILAAILIPKFTGFTDKAKATEAIIQAKQVATAFDAWIEENTDDPEVWVAANNLTAAELTAADTDVIAMSGVPAANFTLEADGGVSVTVNGHTAARTAGNTAIED